VVLASVLEKRVGGFLRGLFTSAVLRMLLATAAMAVPVWFLSHALEARLGTRGLRMQIVTGLVPVVLGGLVYIGAALALRIPEAHALWGPLKRRLRRT